MTKRIEKLVLLKNMELCSQGNWSIVFNETIGNFGGLQTLHIQDCLQDLPNQVCKLHELRHLIGQFVMGLLLIDNMTKLQTLRTVDYQSWMKVNTEKLVNLRDLCILESSDLPVGGTFTFDSIAKLQSLEILSVQVCRASFASLKPPSRCQHLRDFTLNQTWTCQDNQAGQAEISYIFDNPNIGWRSFKRKMLSMRSHSDSKGYELKRPNESPYAFPCPDCMCRMNKSDDSRSSSAT